LTGFLVEMKRLEDEGPDSFKFTTAEDGPQLSVVFAQMENGVAVFAVRGFEYHDGPSPKIELSRADCPGSDSSVLVQPEME
jgi:hypothetical protein